MASFRWLAHTLFSGACDFPKGLLGADGLPQSACRIARGRRICPRPIFAGRAAPPQDNPNPESRETLPLLLYHLQRRQPTGNMIEAGVMCTVNLKRRHGNLAGENGSVIGIRLDVREFHRLVEPIMRAPARVLLFQDEVLRNL